jgi:hypothetical protein
MRDTQTRGGGGGARLSPLRPRAGGERYICGGVMTPITPITPHTPGMCVCVCMCGFRVYVCMYVCIYIVNFSFLPQSFSHIYIYIYGRATHSGDAWVRIRPHTPTLTRLLLHACSYTPTLTRLLLHVHPYTPTLTRLGMGVPLILTRLLLHAYSYTPALTRLLEHA